MLGNIRYNEWGQVVGAGAVEVICRYVVMTRVCASLELLSFVETTSKMYFLSQ